MARAENWQGDRVTIEPQIFCYLKEIELNIMKIQLKMGNNYEIEIY